MNGIKQRFQNPVFLLAFASLIYQILKMFGIEIEQQTFQEIVNILSYLFLGVGVYQSFDNGGQDNQQP